MSQQYPFSGNPYAQADPSTSTNQGYSSSSYPPQSTHPTHPTATGYQDQYQYSDEYQDPYSDSMNDSSNDPNRTLRANPNDYSQGNDEKLPAVGTITSPYGARGQSIDYSDRKGIWTKEDRRAFQKRGVAAKIFRTLFCLIIIAIIFVVSAFTLVVIFARPPNVGLANIEEPDAGDLKIASGGFTFNLTVNIAVSNPNSISATLKHVEAKLYDSSYPTIQIGNGNINDVKIEPNTNTTFPFPAQLKYTQSTDPGNKIIQDIASKCGIGGSRGNLDFKLDLDVTPSILGLSIPISVNGISFSFMCPNVLGSIGSGLADLLGGGSRRDLIDDGNDSDLLGSRDFNVHERRDSIGNDGELFVHFGRALESSFHQLARRVSDSSETSFHDAL